MGIRRRSKHLTPYLLDGPHWQVGPIRDLEVFFSNLHRLTPQGGILCLAASAWSDEGRAFIRDHALPPDGPHPLPSEFDREPEFPIDSKRMALLAEMATRHAAPELAIHIAVYAGDVSVLEWFDVPDDPITVSRAVPEERVSGFAEACGVGWEAR